MTIRFLLVALVLSAQLNAQNRVDPRNMYERVLAVVPLVGSGTASDPVRPEYAPVPGAAVAVTPSAVSGPGSTPVAAQRPGIIAFSYVVSDDGKHALAEFVAVDRAAFKQILADTTVQSFLKGRDSLPSVLSVFQQYKANFTFDMLGAIVP